MKLKNINEKRFIYHDTSVEECVESLENKTTKEKTKRDVKWMEMILRNEKGDENNRLADFTLFRKYGEDYKTSSLRCLVTN